MHEEKFANQETELNLLGIEILNEVQAFKESLSLTKVCAKECMCADGKKPCEDAIEEFRNFRQHLHRTIRELRRLA